MKQKRKKHIVPAFASEAQEADWWYKHRRTLDRDLLEAARTGGMKVLDRKELQKRIAASRTAKVVSIRLAE